MWPLWFNSIRVSKSENCNWRSKFVVTNLSTAAADKFTYDWLRINSFTGLSTRNKFRWVLSTTASRFCEFDRRFSRSSRPPSHGNWMDRSWHGSPVRVAVALWTKFTAVRAQNFKPKVRLLSLHIHSMTKASAALIHFRLSSLFTTLSSRNS